MKKSNTDQMLEAGIISHSDVSDEIRAILDSLTEQEAHAIITAGKKLKGNPNLPALKVGL